MTPEEQFVMTDCCESWSNIRCKFGWFTFADPQPADSFEGIYIMPYVSGYDGEKYRVNYCPVCGADRRNVAIRPTEDKT